MKSVLIISLGILLLILIVVLVIALGTEPPEVAPTKPNAPTEPNAPWRVTKQFVEPVAKDFVEAVVFKPIFEKLILGVGTDKKQPTAGNASRYEYNVYITRTLSPCNWTKLTQKNMIIESIIQLQNGAYAGIHKNKIYTSPGLYPINWTLVDGCNDITSLTQLNDGTFAGVSNLNIYTTPALTSPCTWKKVDGRGNIQIILQLQDGTFAGIYINKIYTSLELSPYDWILQPSCGGDIASITQLNDGTFAAVNKYSTIYTTQSLSWCNWKRVDNCGYMTKIN